MKPLIIIPIFLATIIADGILMPTLFHIHESFLIFAFMAMLIVMYNEEPAIIGWGIAFGLCVEFLLGIDPITLILSWLLALLVWRLASRVVTIQPALNPGSIIPLLIFGSGLLVFMVVAMAGLSRIFYANHLSFETLAVAARTPFIIWYGIIAEIVYLVLFGLAAKKEPKVYYG